MIQNAKEFSIAIVVNIINKLLKIPKKLLTEEQAAEILERVHLRVELARQLRKK